MMLIVSASLVGLCLYAWFPEWARYAGLSGVCYAPLIALLALLGQRTGSIVFPCLAAGVVLKAGVELWLGAGLFAWFGGLPTATEVHVMGLVVGGVAALAWHRTRAVASRQTGPHDLRSSLAGRV